MLYYSINDEGVDLLKESEAFVGVAYPDPVSPLGRALQKAGLWRDTLRGAPIPAEYMHLSAKPWTIGYGFTLGVMQGQRMTQAEADTMLGQRLVPYCKAVLDACKIPANKNQFAAMVVCAWNIGVSGIISSSIIKAHNRGDFAAAGRAFGLWNKAGGNVIQALVTRRAHEAALYLQPVPGDSRVDTPDDEVEPMPQTVQPETSLLRSPIIQGTAATAGTGITALANMADQASTAQSAFGTLAPLMRYWPYIAIAAIIIVAGVVIWERVRQRKGGWA